MKRKQPTKHSYQTDLRIDAAPEQVAAALVRGGAPRQEAKRWTTKPGRKKRSTE